MTWSHWESSMKQLKYSACFILFATILFSSTGLTATLRVPEDYSTIQAAINVAVNGDIVQVSDGFYSGIGFTDISPLGKDVIITSESGPDNCILSGSQSGRSM